MNPPRMYTCSPSWTSIPPLSSSHPSGSSQGTSPEQQDDCLHWVWEPPLLKGEIASFLSSLNLSSNIKHWLQFQSSWHLTPPHILQRGECLESGGRRSWRGHDCLVTCALDPSNQRLLIPFLSLESMLCPQFSQWEPFQGSSLERAMCCWDCGWHTWLNPLEGLHTNF